jgi:hypothetical protein
MRGRGSSRRRHAERRRQVEETWVLDADEIRPPVRAGAEGWLPVAVFRSRTVTDLPYLVRDDGHGLELDVWAPTPDGWAVDRFRLEQRALPFGGARTYLRCPGLPGGPPCGARVLKVYSPVHDVMAFACRDCHRLAYRSSQERPFSIELLRRNVYRPTKPLPSPAAAWRRHERLRAEWVLRSASANRTTDGRGSL